MEAGQASSNSSLPRDFDESLGGTAFIKTYLRFGSVAGSDNIMETISIEHLATASVRGVEPSVPLIIMTILHIGSLFS